MKLVNLSNASVLVPPFLRHFLSLLYSSRRSIRPEGVNRPYSVVGDLALHYTCSKTYCSRFNPVSPLYQLSLIDIAVQTTNVGLQEPSYTLKKETFEYSKNNVHEVHRYPTLFKQESPGPPKRTNPHLRYHGNPPQRT